MTRVQRSDEPATKGALRGLLFLGVVCVLIGVGLIVSDVQSRHRDAEFRACLADIVTEQNAALSARGELAEREARAARLESDATRRLFRDAFAATESAEFYQAYGDYRARLEKVDRKREKIRQGREDNPIPALPEGACE